MSNPDQGGSSRTRANNKIRSLVSSSKVRDRVASSRATRSPDNRNSRSSPHNNYAPQC